MLIAEIVHTHVQNIIYEIKTLIIHKFEYYRCILFQQHPSKLHLGSGDIRFAGYANIDLRKGADYRLDLRRNLPFPDNSVSYIFSEHTFEHFSYPFELNHVFSQCYRVLRRGGRMDFGVPDFKKIITSYYSDQKTFDIYMRDFQSRGILAHFWHTKNDFLDLLVRQEGQHKYIYDFQTLQRMLAESGFINIAKRKHNRFDTKERKDYTLYITCAK